MIKFGYKRGAVEPVITSDTLRSASDMLTSFSQLKVNGLKISDYIASGFRFHPSDRVLFHITEACYQLFYSKGTFASPDHSSNTALVSLSDKKLQKLIRKSPFSEDDLKELIFDLLTKVGFNLDKIYPETGYLKKGTLLSQFRQFVDTFPLPQPNALSKALAEYGQMQAEKL